MTMADYIPEKIYPIGKKRNRTEIISGGKNYAELA